MDLDTKVQYGRNYDVKQIYIYGDIHTRRKIMVVDNKYKNNKNHNRNRSAGNNNQTNEITELKT